MFAYGENAILCKQAGEVIKNQKKYIDQLESLIARRSISFDYDEDHPEDTDLIVSITQNHKRKSS